MGLLFRYKRLSAFTNRLRPRLYNAKQHYATSIYTRRETVPYNRQDKNGTFNVSSNIEPILERNGIIQYTKKNSETDYSIIIPSAFELKTYKEILLQKNTLLKPNHYS